MPLGEYHTGLVVTKGDTAELYGHVYHEDETPMSPIEIDSVVYTIKLPDDTQEVIVGEVLEDGRGFLRYEPSAPGIYVWVAQFIFGTGQKKSYRDEFSVVDPLNDDPVTRDDQITQEVWMRLEDCFDSEMGGPWLRDETLAYFEPSKVSRFIAEGLLRINTYPPLTQLDLSYFTVPIPNPDPNLPPGTLQPDPDRIVIVQATLLSVIKHLMRSYVEQPAVAGAQVVYEDRRDYLMRWQSIYQIEEEAFKAMVALWKRQFLNLGKSALLVSTKAGRLAVPGMRLRNAQRGYW